MRQLINQVGGYGLDGRWEERETPLTSEVSCNPLALGKKRAPSPACESAPWHTSQSNVKDVIQVYKAVAR